MNRDSGNALRARLAAACAPAWRIVGWDTEQGISFSLVRGASWILVELERHNPDRPAYAHTERFNVLARRGGGSRDELGPDGRSLIDRLVSALARAERELPVFERPTSSERAAVREIEVDRALMPEAPGSYYLNPYVGCMIGCEFCYVAERADFSRELAGLPALPWGRWVDVKVNAAEVLREEVKTLTPGPVRMSPILTDPYQPLERRYRVTRGCLEVLRDAGFTPVILTRGARIVEDLELLCSFARAVVGFSIPTDDDRVREQFEPGADPIEERIAALEALHEAGLSTFAVVQPVLPMDPARLAAMLAPIVERVRVDRMHSMERALPLYERAGCPDAATDEWADRAQADIVAALRERGVAIDGLDDLRAIATEASA